MRTPRHAASARSYQGGKTSIPTTGCLLFRCYGKRSPESAGDASRSRPTGRKPVGALGGVSARVAGMTPPLWLDAAGRRRPTRACWTCGTGDRNHAHACRAPSSAWVAAWADAPHSRLVRLHDGVRAGAGTRWLVAARADLGAGPGGESAAAVRAARAALSHGLGRGSEPQPSQSVAAGVGQDPQHPPSIPKDPPGSAGKSD
jgi:hypothetical protein